MSSFDNIVPFPMVPRGFLKYLVLKLMSNGVTHGYEIMNEIERITGGFWRPSPGSIYPLLSSLEEDKCIEKKEEEVSKVDEKGRGGRKKIYAITEKGLDELEECIKELNESIAMRSCCLPPWVNFFKELLVTDVLSNDQKPF
ncbi:MAG: PadR family transcriptional regulator [Candidatus Hodarchaeota archaeon]